jgi:predicted nucleotidyltransferase
MGFYEPFSAIAEKRIPTPDDFLVVRDEIMKKLRDPSKSSVVSFGGVYGSVIPSRGDQTRRSDIDVFLVYPDAQKRRARQLMRDIRQIGHRRNVVVNGRTVSHRNAQLGNHPYGPSFRTMWKRLSAQGMMVGEPAKLGELLFIPKGRTVREEMEHRLESHARRVRRHLVQFLRIVDGNPRNLDRVIADYLQRVVRPLHLYLNIARKMFLWKDGKLDDDRKATVLKAFAAEETFQRMHKPFNDLRRIDREYDQLLDEYVERCEGASKDQLEALHVSYNAALLGIVNRTLMHNMLLFEATLATLHEKRDAGPKARRARKTGAAA